MKFFSSRQQFDYEWSFVSTNIWIKYSRWNHQCPHVLSVDTLDRSVDPETGIIRTERLISCQQNMPSWMRTIIGKSSADNSYVYEISYVDPAAKRVTMCSRNMTWSELISVQETVVYTPHPDAAGKTLFEQQAKIIALCGGWQKIKNTIEDFTVERFRQNAAAGREGFERVLAISRQAFAEQREQRRREQYGVTA